MEVTDNNNGQEQIPSPEDFVSSLNGGDLGTGFEVPNEIAGIDKDAFLSGLTSLNENITSYDDFASVLSASKELSELKSSYASLEQQYQSARDPWANDFVRELNALMSNGNVSQAEIDHYIKMQNLDLDKMSTEQILLLQRSQRYPNMSKEKVEAAFNEEFGNPEEWSEGFRASMDQKAYDAKAELAKMKKDASRPNSLAAQEDSQRAMEQKYNYWANVESKVEVPNSFSLDRKLSSGAEFKFDFPLPEGALEQLRGARVQYLTQKVKQGDRKGYDTVNDFSKSWLYANYGDEIIAAAIEHATASTSRDKDKEHHNVKPTLQGKDRKPQINDKTQAHLERLRKQGLGE